MNNNEISNAYIGSTKVDKIYLGEKLIFPNIPSTPSEFNYNGVVQVDNVGDFDILSPDDRYRYNVQVDNVGDFDILSPDDRYRYNVQVDNVGDFDITVINNNTTNTNN